MDKNKANVPKIRFPGFTDPWEQRKLGEVTNSYSGGTPSVGKSEYYDGDIPFIRSAEINSDITELFISESGLNNSSAKMVEIGDILYALYGATSGEVGICSITGAINQAILAIQPKDNYDSQFIMQWLRSEKQNIINKYLQGGQGNLSGSIVKDLQIKFPNYDEQVKIGKLFAQLDNLITLHQRKLNHLQDKKKSLLQKMFPKNGEDFPELRFPGFTDPWEQRKLGDMVPITMGQSPNGSTYSDIPNDYILVQGNADLKNGWVTPRVWTSQVTKKAEAGDLIMSVRAPAGEMGKTAYNVVIGRGVAAIKGNEFIFQSLVKMNGEGYWKKFSCGSTFESLNSDNIKNAEIMIPNLDEQAQIGVFFKNLDTLIALHQRKLNHLQEQKKALLQQMFV
ncbi:MAG: restriction endonuclease subunit S [Clostridium tyrobutyricum]|jgi:type I restriction enzyme S subunit|uniref:restriction endonuclease subunit S n=1 Tax=Clostridium tyrobutyricum TaxID=1519 RepID=UPI00242F29D5|nr:restriction endonuclease subunit S [Clostridium tyrobutyricum]MCH4200056.1 restriction endonuclease subunit S [Clostridium tyrobutyricum]MCH4236643.1 restriction endonuclease subunit S [Clostridium tyrobutyricum]MCH4257976.1 restriction endonuclease subunit S [Clostridium tyrobutyricum]MCI1239014.1 restriction endonuclease subunit S [Clostridium tyrobutyricum]MCI1650960.1 restriction endonuclease subunit S [Clostridium tyrobutyricum]